MPRVFVGTLPPAEVGEVIADYPRQAITGVRWSTPAQHLVVLREVGDVMSDTVGELAAALGPGLAGLPAAQASLGTVKRDGGIMAEVDGLDAHTDAVFEATIPVVSATLNADRQARIVIARGRVPKELVLPVRSVTWTVDELVMVTESRTKDGPGFEVVATFALGR